MTVDKKSESTKIIILVLLVLNLLVGVYIAFFKRDALWLETMKAGGAANMHMAQQLYTSPVYIQQQKTTLDQILGSMNQAAIQPTTTTTPTAQPEVQPTVTK